MLLVRNEHDILNYTYAPHYVASAASINLSLSMPLSDAPYGDAACRAFFGNLLQERDDTIQRLMDKERIARDDIASLLLHLGKDCPGAISVLAHGAPPAKVPGNFMTDYVPLTRVELERIVTALHERAPLPDEINDPPPIAGVQSKIALTLLPDGNFAQSLKNSGAPTTHILKVSNKNRPNETKLEAIAMWLSKSMGITQPMPKTMKLLVSIHSLSPVTTAHWTRMGRGPSQSGRLCPSLRPSSHHEIRTQWQGGR